MNEQIVLLDDQLWPHEIHQFAPGHNTVAALDQRKQDVEGARAELGRHAIDRHATLQRVDLYDPGAIKVARSRRVPAVHGRQIRPDRAMPVARGRTINKD